MATWCSEQSPLSKTWRTKAYKIRVIVESEIKRKSQLYRPFYIQLRLDFWPERKIARGEFFSFSLACGFWVWHTPPPTLVAFSFSSNSMIKVRISLYVRTRQQIHFKPISWLTSYWILIILLLTAETCLISQFYRTELANLNGLHLSKTIGHWDMN